MTDPGLRGHPPITDPAHPLAGMRTDRGSRTPLARQIADAVIKAIREGRYRPGDYLPSGQQLREVVPGCSQTMRARAWALLVTEGWAEQHPGIGLAVRARGESE